MRFFDNVNRERSAGEFLETARRLCRLELPSQTTGQLSNILRTNKGEIKSWLISIGVIHEKKKLFLIIFLYSKKKIEYIRFPENKSSNVRRARCLVLYCQSFRTCVYISSPCINCVQRGSLNEYINFLCQMTASHLRDPFDLSHDHQLIRSISVSEASVSTHNFVSTGNGLSSVTLFNAQRHFSLKSIRPSDRFIFQDADDDADIRDDGPLEWFL